MSDVLAQEVDADGGLYSKESYIVLVLELVVDESFDDAGLAGAGVPEEDDLEGAFADGGRSY